MVRAEGLEPPRVTPLEPKSSASTNSATPAAGHVFMRPRALCPYASLDAINAGLNGYLRVIGLARQDRIPALPVVVDAVETHCLAWFHHRLPKFVLALLLNGAPLHLHRFRMAR